ncbi:hypothetical protein [Homoserinimonas hongtaonis]|uniref:WXG100 family type VII secretion target n=1 Tax=Homoserinimonas hongtaonis TaxID=2079791 RepID=A0A2U1SWH6_9MICO|nr:hypothetical protein [Salinibacterium hongtaonis]PWB95977.1 hypothetical protein DF220_11250 [Salinibacterium hongtaonis]
MTWRSPADSVAGEEQLSPPTHDGDGLSGEESVADIQIDYGAIEHSRSEIDSAVSTLRQAGSLGSDIAGLVGHSGLASQVQDFADGWDINRGRLVDELTAISDSLQAIVDAFTDLDQQMANAAGGEK